MKKTKLLLSSGESFDGMSPKQQTSKTFGEVVFNTGMTGYVETLTDPSYSGQIITFTYPLIGNYGALPENYWESKKIHAAGVIVSTASEFFSHSKATQSFLEWLYSQNTPIITSIDTRQLTKTIREKGVTSAAIVDSELNPTDFEDINSQHLVANVSIDTPQIIQNGNKKLIVVDCGIKENILRSLKKFPLTIKVVPFDYDYSKEEFDAVFLSNGPGDPIQCKETIENLQKVLHQSKPIFGICLGAQILALSIGCQTYKLKFGHRGQNQPVMHLDTKKCYLTSQNHGYAINEQTIPEDWTVSYRHLNDDSVQGIVHKTRPFSAVQFHPEACPGPSDTQHLFQTFFNQIDHHVSV